MAALLDNRSRDGVSGRCLVRGLAVFALVLGLFPFGQLQAQNGDDVEEGSPAASTNTNLGQQVFYQVCSSCHGNGENGAPRIGHERSWRARIDQGMDVLIEHAIQGHQGSKGTMPARGGVPELTDQEIEAAVSYVVAHSEGLSRYGDDAVTACRSSGGDDGECSSDMARRYFIIQVLLRLSGKGTTAQ